MEYRSKLKLRHKLDIRRIEKTICESVLGTLSNIDKKTKNTGKGQLDLHDLGITCELHLKLKNGKWYKKLTSYTFNLVERKKFCSLLKSIKFPNRYTTWKY